MDDLRIIGCPLMIGCLFFIGCGERVRNEQKRTNEEPAAIQPVVQPVAKEVDGARSDAKPESVIPNAAPPQDDAGTTNTTQSSLVVRIELDETDGETALDFNTPFRVALLNNTDEPVTIWNPKSETGNRQITFRFKNLRTGETHLVQKGNLDDNEFWKSQHYLNDANSEPIEIDSINQMTEVIHFGEFAWEGHDWKNLPDPNTDDRFEVTARLESMNDADAPQQTVPPHRIQIVPVSIRFIANKLKSPHDYLRFGFPRTAIEIMKADPDWISKRDKGLFTPLHIAAQYGHCDAVKWLLDHGADINASGMSRLTPLHVTDDIEAIKLILEKHPDLKIRCVNGRTALQTASEKLVKATDAETQEKLSRIVKLYAESGADYDIITAIYLNDLEQIKKITETTPAIAHGFQNKSPLRIAASLGRLDICRYLIEEHHSDVDDFDRGNGYPIIKEALPHPDVVKLLIKSDADLITRITWRGMRSGVLIIGDDATILHYAAADSTPDIVNLLIENGVDIFAAAIDTMEDDKEQTALEVAAHFGRGDNAEVIVRHPTFDMLEKDNQQNLLDKCLRIASFTSSMFDNNQRPKLIEVLLDKGANPNADDDGVTAIQIASRNIHPGSDQENSAIKQIIDTLRKHGASLDLFSAVAIGDEVEVRRLLEKNPQSANSRGKDGIPSLQFAVGMNYKEIVSDLLRAGGDVEIGNLSEERGSVDETALHCAAFWGRYEIAKILIEAGANVNSRDCHNVTPLHEAIRLKNLKIVRLLLDSGAKPDARDDNNESPRDSWHAMKNQKWQTSNQNDAIEIEKLFREFEAANPQ